MKGTIYTASIHVHSGIEYSRRDDLLSLLYTMLSLMRGEQGLPWKQMIESKDQLSKAQHLVGRIKLKLKPEDFEEVRQANLVRIIKHVESTLEFEDEPDYEHVKKAL